MVRKQVRKEPQKTSSEIMEFFLGHKFSLVFRLIINQTNYKSGFFIVISICKIAAMSLNDAFGQR
jgi:hypothetical protein